MKHEQIILTLKTSRQIQQQVDDGNSVVEKRELKINQHSLEGGLEPPTLWLTATRSSQLSYSSNFTLKAGNKLLVSLHKKLGF